MTNTRPPYTATEREDLFGRKIATRLSEGTTDLPYNVGERLRAARMQALARRKVAQTQVRKAVLMASSGGAAALMFGRDEPGLWGRLTFALSLAALVAGLTVINTVLDDDRANEMAEVDAALLTDDLPPAAYTDPGFLQYLRSAAAPQQQQQQ